MTTDEPSGTEQVAATADERRPSRTAPLLLGVLIGVLVSAVVGLTIALVVSDGEEEGEVATTTTATDTTFVPTTPVNGDLRGVALRIDVLLEKSARARGDVVDVISQVEDGCGLEPGAASMRLYDAEQSRAQVITDLSSLQVTGNAEADQLVALLLAAVQDSQHANHHYLAWLNDEYTRFYYENATYDEVAQTMTVDCPGPPPKGEDWDLAAAASADATQSKQAFVEAYGPVAERFDLRTWSAGEL